MSVNISDSLRLSTPISSLNEKLMVEGNEMIPVAVHTVDGLKNQRVSLNSISLYTARQISMNPAFTIPTSAITGLSDVLGDLTSVTTTLGDRMDTAEGDITQLQEDLAFYSQGLMLRNDNWI